MIGLRCAFLSMIGLFGMLINGVIEIILIRAGCPISFEAIPLNKKLSYHFRESDSMAKVAVISKLNLPERSELKKYSYGTLLHHISP